MKTATSNADSALLKNNFLGDGFVFNSLCGRNRTVKQKFRKATFNGYRVEEWHINSPIRRYKIDKVTSVSVEWTCTAIDRAYYQGTLSMDKEALSGSSLSI